MRTTTSLAAVVLAAAVAVGCQATPKDQMTTVGNGSQPQTMGTHDNPMVNSDGTGAGTNVSGTNAPSLNGSSATPSVPVGGGSSQENGGSSAPSGMSH